MIFVLLINKCGTRLLFRRRKIGTCYFSGRHVVTHAPAVEGGWLPHPGGGNAARLSRACRSRGPRETRILESAPPRKRGSPESNMSLFSRTVDVEKVTCPYFFR